MKVRFKEMKFKDCRYPTEEEIKELRFRHSLEMAILSGFIDESDVHLFKDYLEIVEKD